MPKKIKFESFKYRLLAAAEEYQILDYEDLTWDEFLNSIAGPWVVGFDEPTADILTFNEILAFSEPPRDGPG